VPKDAKGAPDAWLVLERGVRNLEALDGTPIVDVKPVLDAGVER
jgi:hypothetical protein